MNHTVGCPHCGGAVSFHSDQNGTEATCPHCHEPILLQYEAEGTGAVSTEERVEPAAQPSIAPRPGWDLFNRVFPGKQRKESQVRQAAERQEQIATIMERVRQGTWQVEARKMVLLMGERALWSEPVGLVSPRDIGKSGSRSEGLAGALKKFSSRIPGFAAAPAGTVLGRGELIVTNHRLVFVGGDKSFITHLGKVNDLHLFSDGFKYAEGGTGRIRAIKYEQPNGDIMQAIMSFAVENQLQES